MIFFSIPKIDRGNSLLIIILLKGWRIDYAKELL